MLIGIILLGCEQSATNSQTSVTSANALPASTEFDLVILNGRVMDPETNFDAVRNVGVKDGVIGLISEEILAGKKTTDATGTVVVENSKVQKVAAGVAIRNEIVD